ncbi:MAG: hypothetical protein ACRDKE_12220, partial [Solirubrobacterales bacterium]
MKRLLTTLVLAAALLATAATTASADEFSFTSSSYALSETAPVQVTVTADYSISDFQEQSSITQFVVEAWAPDCNSGDFWGNFGDQSQVTVPEAGDGTATATFNVSKQTHYCVASYYVADGSFVALHAQPLYFDRARVEYDSEATYPTSLEYSLTVQPGGLPTTYQLSYFKKVNTDQCSSPDLADLATAQTTEPTTIDWSLDEDHETVQTITGLEMETAYCVAFLAENIEGSNGVYYWGNETTGDVPTVSGITFTPAVSRIDYAADVTPNSNTWSAHIRVQYFLKNGDEACADYEGAQESEYYYGPGGNQPSGFTSTYLSSSVYDIDPGTYCIRLFGVNDYGDSAEEAWQVVSTTSMAAPAISELKFAPPTTPGAGKAQLIYHLSDSGAAFSNYNNSVAGITLFKTDPQYCDNDYYSSGTEALTSNYQFSGENDNLYNLSGLTPGANYCFHAVLLSSWGSGFDTTFSQNIVFGEAPSFSNVGVSRSTTSVTISADFEAGFIEASYAARYFEKPADVSCDDYDDESEYTDTTEVTTSLSEPQAIATTITGLTPDTMYCVQYLSENEMGGAQSAMQQVSTLSTVPPDTTNPSKVTGLASSNITKTSATLSWNAGTDNIGVTGYTVYENGDELDVIPGTSLEVPLQCGEASSFAVQSYDAAGNHANMSDALVITGAACDVVIPPAPPAETPVPPAAKKCLAPIKGKTITGKFKKGKKKGKFSLKISGKLAADGQSIKISLSKKNVKASVKVDGKSYTTGSITLLNNPSLVTVTYKATGGRN